MSKTFLFEASTPPVQFKKVVTKGKEWWYVKHDESWFAISGEPSIKLTPIPIE